MKTMLECWDAGIVPLAWQVLGIGGCGNQHGYTLIIIATKNTRSRKNTDKQWL
jgi:hypothetical protein